MQIWKVNTWHIIHTTYFYTEVTTRVHIKSLPSLCDFSRCWVSSTDVVKQSEQCLHEYVSASVWISLWRFSSSYVTNSFLQSGQWYGILLPCIWRSCSCKWRDSLKLLLHSEHLYGLSPVWTLMCLFRSPDSLNALSHMWHLYGFSLLWILLWLTRRPARVNRLLQTLHSNGFSPEWLRLCAARWLLLGQHLPHSVHLYLPVWIFLWSLSVFCDKKVFSHSLHEYTLYSCVYSCIRFWAFQYLFLLNRLSYTVHKYGVGLLQCSVISSVLISNGWDLSVLSASVSNSKEEPACTQH